MLSAVQGKGEIFKEFIKSIALYPFPQWVDGVYWTLGIEMAFYLAVLCLLIFNAFRHMQTFAYTIGSISASYWFLGLALWPEFIQRHLWDRAFELSLVNYGIYFSLGILAYTIFRRGVLVLDGTFGALLIAAAAIEIGFKSHHNNLVFQTQQPSAVPIAIFAFVMATIVGTAKWKPSDRAGRRLRLIGLSTYPLYLIHDHFGAFVLRAFATMGLPRYIALLSAMALCVGVSLIIARWIEPSVQRLVKYTFDRIALRSAGQMPTSST